MSQRLQLAWTRTSSDTGALIVTINNPDRSELYLPEMVEIPADEDHVEFPVGTVNDGEIDGDVTGLSIGVSASGGSASVLVDVTDDDTASTKTLGGHLFEPISADSYTVLFDIDVDSGDTLVVAPGSVLKFDSGVAMNVDGVLTANGDAGSEVVFTSSIATPMAGDWQGITITSSSATRTLLDYVEVSYAVSGITVSPLATHPKVTVSQSEIHDNSDAGLEILAGSAQTISASDVIIDDNYVHDNVDGVRVSSSSGVFSALSTGTPTKNNTTIEGNEIANNSGVGIVLSARTSPFNSNLGGVSSEIAATVIGNHIHGNARGIVGSATPGSFSIFTNTRDEVVLEPAIQNNLIVNHTSHGIEVTTDSIALPRRIRPQIGNNTITDNGGNGVLHAADTSTGFSVLNNVFAGNNRGIASSASYTPDAGAVGFNLLHNNSSGDFDNYPAAFGTISTTNANGTPSDNESNIFEDPLFFASDDFHILFGSPAVDAGTTSGSIPTTDFDGLMRVGSPDIGAFERPIATRINELYVNPTDVDDAREYAELRTLSGTAETLHDLTLLVIDGDTANAGVVDGVIPLDGFTSGSNGLLLLGNNYTASNPWAAQTSSSTAVGAKDHAGASGGQATGSIDNDSTTFLIVSGFTGSATDDLDTNDDGTLDVNPWIEIVDSVGWTDGEAGDHVYSAAVLTQSSGTPDAATRFPNDATANSTTAWYNGDVFNGGVAGGLDQAYDEVNVSQTLSVRRDDYAG